MIRLCKYNQKNVLEKVRHGKLDAIALNTSNLIDEIILEMNNSEIFNCLRDNIPDLRAHNTTIPYELIWASAVAAKMKVQTSLSDIPFAIHDHRTLAKLGYTLVDTDGNLKIGLMREGSLRFLLGKYDPKLFINGYNDTVQKGIMPLLDLVPNIHILDCTDLEVNLKNENYEYSEIGHNKIDGRPTRGYKLSTLRGIVDDIGIIEEIRFGKINTHDLKLSEEMLKTTPVLKPGDILINDRGFLSRELLNYLKLKREVDLTFLSEEIWMPTMKQYFGPKSRTTGNLIQIKNERISLFLLFLVWVYIGKAVILMKMFLLIPVLYGIKMKMNILYSLPQIQQPAQRILFEPMSLDQRLKRTTGS